MRHNVWSLKGASKKGERSAVKWNLSSDTEKELQKYDKMSLICRRTAQETERLKDLFRIISGSTVRYIPSATIDRHKAWIICHDLIEQCGVQFIRYFKIGEL